MPPFRLAKNRIRKTTSRQLDLHAPTSAHPSTTAKFGRCKSASRGKTETSLGSHDRNAPMDDGWSPQTPNSKQKSGLKPMPPMPFQIHQLRTSGVLHSPTCVKGVKCCVRRFADEPSPLKVELINHAQSGRLFAFWRKLRPTGSRSAERALLPSMEVSNMTYLFKSL